MLLFRNIVSAKRVDTSHTNHADTCFIDLLLLLSLVTIISPQKGDISRQMETSRKPTLSNNKVSDSDTSSTIIFQAMFQVTWLAQCVLTILELNKYERFGDRRKIRLSSSAK